MGERSAVGTDGTCAHSTARACESIFGGKSSFELSQGLDEGGLEVQDYIEQLDSVNASWITVDIDRLHG